MGSVFGTIAVETPATTLIRAAAGYKVVEYPRALAASYTSPAGDEGSLFRPLAAYIFGETQSGAKVAMTAPVVTSENQQGEKIAMTAPVVTRSNTMMFILPSQYLEDRESLPMPKNDAIEIVEIPPRRVAVREFSGWASWYEQDERRALVEALQRDNVETSGEPWLQQYNPPWTLPWWRKNEVCIEVRQ